ncbi:MAG: hypothetical protein ACQEWV_07330 [Bacillota bacterium]
MEFEDHYEEAQKIDRGKNEFVGHEEDSNTPPVDRFSELMFGTRPTARKQENKHEPKHSNKDENKTDEVNYFTLMEQINDIMVSLGNLKPILKEFTPIMDYIKKKI